MSPTLNGIDLEQYKTQAKDLLRAAHAAQPEALHRIATAHPEGANLTASGRLRLADTQLVLAREHGSGSWRALKEHLIFQLALHSLDSGNAFALAAVLQQHPTVLQYRCRQGVWYESGYFQGAMLLHHVAGNPIRCPLPADIVAITQTLLQHGADPNARTDAGETTLGLLFTSRQASETGVALPLVDLLCAAGATGRASESESMLLALTNAAPATAAALERRGATMDIRHAAGLGDLEALEKLLHAGEQADLLEDALVIAVFRGENEAARLLVRCGARGDVLVTPGGHAPQTALHNAAHQGNTDLVRLLLEKGADTTVRDARWNGTPADWARAGEHAALAALLDRQTADRAEA